MLSFYDYQFPKTLIAQKPAHPRDAARLLVYDRSTKKTSFDTFRNLGTHLPEGAVLVMNDTKVVPARFTVHKQTGGSATLLYLETQKGLLKVMSDRALRVGSKLLLTNTISFVVAKQEERFFFLKPSFSVNQIFEILEKHGRTPLPPYLDDSSLSESARRKEYQTVWAKKNGSVAAPTASLHFTKRLLAQLTRQGIDIVYTTLHVNLGTFAPVTDEQIVNGTLHSEYYDISKKTAQMIEKAARDGRPIIAVGTTVARTLESAANAQGKLQRLNGATDLFIRPGYRFKIVDGLITNFHVPRSSLLMLVAALISRKTLLEFYRTAIRKKFRLFSFGDAMIIK